MLVAAAQAVAGLLPAAVLTWLAAFIDTVIAPLLLPLVRSGWVPDFVIRFGIRAMLKDRLVQCDRGSLELNEAAKQAYIKDLRARPIAEQTESANEQHYTIPTEFFELCMGRWRKYSCCLYTPGITSLTDAEAASLALVCERAELANARRVLDAGCGWGSFSLYALQHFPEIQVTAVSNSPTQKAAIEAKAKAMGVANRLTVITANMQTFQAEAGKYDRVISIEMFEHMKNYQELLAKVATWLVPGGKAFVHTFAHKQFAYHFLDGWMAENFFTGGQMPSADLFLHFQDDLKVRTHWWLNGQHYAKTLRAWLDNMDDREPAARAILAKAYNAAGPMAAETTGRLVDWRLFYMACEELFAYNGGDEWGVVHYLFEKPATKQ